MTAHTVTHAKTRPTGKSQNVNHRCAYRLARVLEI
jgi:hypothetical protein